MRGPGDVRDPADLERRPQSFQHRYQQTAKPFDWRYTRAGLDRLLRRLDPAGPLAQAA